MKQSPLAPGNTPPRHPGLRAAAAVMLSTLAIGGAMEIGKKPAAPLEGPPAIAQTNFEPPVSAPTQPTMEAAPDATVAPLTDRARAAQEARGAAKQAVVETHQAAEAMQDQRSKAANEARAAIKQERMDTHHAAVAKLQETRAANAATAKQTAARKAAHTEAAQAALEQLRSDKAE